MGRKGKSVDEGGEAGEDQDEAHYEIYVKIGVGVGFRCCGYGDRKMTARDKQKYVVRRTASGEGGGP